MNKPKTIADLKINWDFNFETYLDFDIFRKDFQKRNRSLKDYGIVSNKYCFKVFEENNTESIDSFSINTYNLTLKHYCTLFDLMFEIDWELSSNLFSKSENYSYSLERFEKVSEDEYNIVLRKVLNK